MSQGAAAAAYMGGVGPKSITHYNWNRFRTPENDTEYFKIQHQVEACGPGKYRKHSLDDIVTLTEEGEQLRRSEPGKVLYKLDGQL
mmetsp:Transcript_32124/g.78822  ORF Transcript_32124/g.78822 Transcript_32124/m.78822 type:complete len:86 (+) Transcript_32124:539-796(+)